MRARNIKPGFFKNEELVKLSEAVRLLFIGLWCMADRKGRLEDRPMRIKMEIYPADQHDINTMLEQLKNAGFILRYEVEGNRFIQVINFEKHQYPNIREKDSTIPAPYKHRTSTEQKRLNPSLLNTESPILNTAAPDDPGAAFESVWAAYPKRRGRKNAERHYRASVKTPEDVRAIRRALANYKKEIQGKDLQYVKNGDTWFNNWRDYLEDLHASNGGKSIVEQSRHIRPEEETERIGELVSTGQVLARIRDLQDVSDQTKSNP